MKREMDADREEKIIRIACIAALSVVLVLCVTLGILGAVRSRIYVPPADSGVPFTREILDGPNEVAGEVPDFPRSAARFNFLVVGIDRVAGLSDAVMVINYDTDTGKISVVQIPRDTYIEYGGSGHKLNSVLPELGSEGLCTLLERSLCINIDYTAVVDLDAFGGTVDAIGGVKLNVPSDMDYEDPEQGLYIHLKAGEQILDGDKAQQFVRFRSGYQSGDLGRVNAQKQFMTAFLSQLRERLDTAAAVKIAQAVLPAVQTDIGINECAYFAEKILRGSGAEGLVMMTAPGRAVSTGTTGGSYYVLGRAAMLGVVNEYLNVYENDVTDALFDRDRIFVKDGDDDFERVYTYSIITPQTVGEEK